MSDWTTPDGRRLTVTEDEPGVVKITTEALEQLLQQAGMSRAEPDAEVTEMTVTRQVLRDSNGRCQECGSTPAEYHREDCPHYRGEVAPYRRGGWQPPYEVRPAMPGDVERR